MAREIASTGQRISEIASMLPLWKDKPREQVIVELASFATETKRVPDKYHFLVTDKLISPITNQSIEDSVDKQSDIGRLEFEAFEKIQDFAVKNEQGTAIWISPLVENKYPSSKIIFSTIKKEPGRQKALYNTSLVVDTNEKECLDIANLVSDSEYFTEADQLRKSPIFVPTKIAKLWMKNLSVVYEQLKEKSYQKGVAFSALNIILSKLPQNFDFYAQARYIVEAAREKELLGDYKTSCVSGGSSDKPTAVELFTKNSQDFKDAFFECPKCHRPIPSGQGITTCPHCGAKKEDYGKCV